MGDKWLFYTLLAFFSVWAPLLSRGFDEKNDIDDWLRFASQRYAKLGSDNITCMAFSGDEETIYIGSDGGVFFIKGDELAPFAPGEYAPKNVLSIAVSGCYPREKLWVGTKDGLYLYHQNKYQNFTASEWDPALQAQRPGNSNIPGNIINDILVIPDDAKVADGGPGRKTDKKTDNTDNTDISDQDAHIFVATNQGIGRFYDNKWQVLANIPDVYNPTRIVPLSSDLFIVAGNPGQPAFLNIGKNTFQAIKSPVMPEKNSRIQVQDGKFLYSATPFGIAKMLISNQNLTKLDQIDIPYPCTSLAMDLGGNLYIGSSGGLFFYNSEEKNPKATMLEKVWVQDLIIRPSVNDDKQVLWLATKDKGLWRKEIWQSKKHQLINSFLEPARTFLIAGKNDAALDLLEKIIALDPNYSRAHIMAGDILYGQKHYARAIPYLEKAVDLTQSADSGAKLAQAYFMVNRPELAVNKFREALAHNPENTSIRMGLIQSLDLSGKLLAAYKEIVPLLNGPTQEVEILIHGASIARRLGRLFDAIKINQKAIKQYPRDLRSSVELARIYLGQRKYQEGAEILKSARQFGENTTVLNLLATLYNHNRQFPQAEEAINSALAQEPDTVEHQLVKLKILIAQKYFVDAERELAFCLRTKPQEYRYQIIRGDLLFHRSQFEDAINTYNQALMINPDNPDALIGKAKTISSVFTQKIEYNEELRKTLNHLVMVDPNGIHHEEALRIADFYKIELPQNSGGR